MCTGDSLWLLICTILVYGLGTGIAFVMAGAIRSKNVVSVFYQSFMALLLSFLLVGIVPFGSVLGLSFGHVSDLVHREDGCATGIQFLFQTGFLFVALVSILGATLERMKPHLFLILAFFWGLLVYMPIAHSLWHPTGFLRSMGVVDFAGGFVVHMSAGGGALALSYLLGRRKDYFNLKHPFQVGYVFLGCNLIFLGWMGFNIGSLNSFSGKVGFVGLTTLTAGVSSVMTWFFLDKLHPPYRISFLRLSFALVTGLVSVTASADSLDFIYASIVSGACTGIVFYGLKFLNRVLKVDDPMEVFSSHGLAAFCGVVLTAFFLPDKVFWKEIVAAVLVMTYSFVATYGVGKGIGFFSALRVDDFTEQKGLDLTMHGEQAIYIDRNEG